jgi:aryl-alcohol dehydrogenase-like predicted oxidoreductase
MAQGDMDWLREKSLTDKKINAVKALEKLAGEINTNVTDLSIAWVIKNPDLTCAILGATKKEQLEQNLRAMELAPKLTDEIMDKIDGIVKEVAA